MSLLFGLPGIQPDSGDVQGWSARRVTLPEGWKTIEVDRLWIRGKPVKLTARHGEVARLRPSEPTTTRRRARAVRRP
jgi:protein-glucosylgalactosylhydroxylysine glucosidase